MIRRTTRSTLFPYTTLFRSKGSCMKKEKDKKESELPSDEGELVVTEEEYQARLKKGWTDDDMLKPGRYKFKRGDRKSTRLNSSHQIISYAVFCLKKKKK